MREFAYRLTKGDDLKSSLEKICIDNGFNTAVVISAVGCVSKAKIRLASAKDYLKIIKDFEIVSLNGTISNGNAHIHIALSDDKGYVYGGHLCEDTIINTTCEIVLAVLEEYESKREYDKSTGYDEIIFRKKA